MLSLSPVSSFGDLLDFDGLDTIFGDEEPLFDDLFFENLAPPPVETKPPEPAVKANPYEKMRELFTKCIDTLTQSEDPKKTEMAKSVVGRLFTTLQSQETTYWASNPEVCRKVVNAFFESGPADVQQIFTTNIALIFESFSTHHWTLVSGLMSVQFENTENSENLVRYRLFEKIVNVKWGTTKSGAALANKLLHIFFIKLSVDTQARERLQKVGRYILRDLSTLKSEPKTWQKKELEILVSKSLKQVDPQLAKEFTDFKVIELMPETKKAISVEIQKGLQQFSKQQEICKKMNNHFLLFSTLLELPLTLGTHKIVAVPTKKDN